MQIHDQSTNIATQAANIADFVDTYGDRIPDGLGHLSLDTIIGGAKFTISLTSRPEADRIKGLLAVADIFGREGWVSEPAYDNRSLNWHIVIGGVKVQVMGAAPLPPLVAAPVPASKFPLQLEDGQ